MPYEIITVPFNPVTHLFSAENLNRFCLNKMVRSSRVEFFNDGENSYWTVFLEYQSATEPASKESAALTDAGKLCFEKLREWRRVTAEKDGVPPYVIATNSHLADIVRKEVVTLESLKQIEGFGAKKIERYGKEITDIIRGFFNCEKPQ